MSIDTENLEQEEYSGSSQTRRRKNSGRSRGKLPSDSKSAPARDAGEPAGPSPSSLNWLLSVLQSDLGEIKDFGGTVRLYGDPNGLIIQLPNVAICQTHKMMHFGPQCPIC